MTFARLGSRIRISHSVNKTNKIHRPQIAGPGSMLAQKYKDDGIPQCQMCTAMTAKMNEWGVEGCRSRLNEIVEDILPRAKSWIKDNRPIIARWTPDVVQDVVLRKVIRNDVIDAINQYEALENEKTPVSDFSNTGVQDQ